MVALGLLFVGISALPGSSLSPASAAQLLHSEISLAPIVEPVDQLVGSHATGLSDESSQEAPSYDQRTIGFFVAATLGTPDMATTSATVTSYVYDSARTESWGPRTLSGLDAYKNRLSIATSGWELRSRAPPIRRFIAAEVEASRTVVIGEDMEGRVIPTAQKIGADWYHAPDAPPERWMENDRQWINDQMDQGCTIVDCGPAPGRANFPSATSPYYQMELDQIAARDYQLYQRIQIDGEP